MEESVDERPSSQPLPDTGAVVGPASLINPDFEESYHAARDRVIHLFEVQYLMWLVNRAQGNLAEAARVAGVNRTTLYRMMVRNRLHRAPMIGWVTAVGAEQTSQRDVSMVGAAESE